MTQNIQWTKPVCQLDADHLYIGQTTADLDIMARDGSYLIPAGCIDTDPPQISAGKAARWNGEGWDFIEDHRGKTAYRKTDRTAVIIDQIGSLSDDLTFLKPSSRFDEWDGEKWMENQDKKAQIEAEFLNASKATLIRAINRQAQNIVAQKSGMDDLPAFEVQSWPIQVVEARAWSVDKSAATPVLDQIAQSRGIDADKLKAAALRKTVAYESLCATVAGKRQAIEKQIEAAQNLDELNVINTEINI